MCSECALHAHLTAPALVRSALRGFRMEIPQSGSTLYITLIMHNYYWWTVPTFATPRLSSLWFREKAQVLAGMQSWAKAASWSLFSEARPNLTWFLRGWCWEGLSRCVWLSRVTADAPESTCTDPTGVGFTREATTAAENNASFQNIAQLYNV